VLYCRLANLRSYRRRDIQLHSPDVASECRQEDTGLTEIKHCTAATARECPGLACHHLHVYCHLRFTLFLQQIFVYDSSAVLESQQVVQLSQRDRAAGLVSFGQKWKMIFCRQYRSIFNHCDVIGLLSFGEIKQNKGYYAVQGHSRSPMSVPIASPYATSY